MKQSQFYVYILRSLADGRRYIGLTNDARRRLQEHNGGHTISTRGRRPFVIDHVEEFDDRNTAREREKYLKSGAGRRYLATLHSEKTRP